jgi:outer membrane protein assembly factor BamE (lipoprotein component of BamABCDE complex)
MKNFEITPYVGVGALKFGMTRANTRSILGEPSSTKKSRFSVEVTDYWMENRLQLTFADANGVLLEVSLYPGLENVQLHGVKVFEESGFSVFSNFCKIDNAVRQTVGVTIFFTYGVAMTGFLNEDDDQKSITAFSTDRWSINDPELKPYSFVGNVSKK